MPFIVQCPYADCGKFMLVEDSQRGQAVDCLICKRTIQLGGSPHEGTALADAEHRYSVRMCGQCRENFRVPSSAANQPARCPHCGQVTPAQAS